MAKSTSTKPGSIAAIAFLSNPNQHSIGPACAVSGNETFLKREVLLAMRQQVLGGEQDEFSLATFGCDSDFLLRDVFDALATVSLFGSSRRMVILEDADDFVSEHRAELEKYVAKPHRNSVLVFEVKSWPATTRLANAVATVGISIDCKAPDRAQSKRWLVDRAKSRYGVRIDAAAVDTMLELLPSELGILDQELSKLSLLVNKGSSIDETFVAAHVGNWRTRTTWDMVDAAADGRAATALEQLGRLLDAGEAPQALLPQLSHSLRQLASATQAIEAAEAERSRISLGSALQQANVPSFKVQNAERQLRQLGRERAKQLTDWLLAADLALKGTNSLPARARMELERLIIRLSATASPPATKRG